MTQADLDEILAMSGINDPDPREAEKKWADTQLTNQPKVENPLPEPSIEDFQMTVVSDQHIDDTAHRLNGLLGNNFSKDLKIERL